MDTFEKRHALVRTKRTWLFVAQAVAVLPQIVVIHRLVLYPGDYLVASMITMATVITFGVAWQRWWQVRFFDVRADAAGFYLGGHLACPRSSIRLAHTIRDRGRVVVRLARRLRPIEIVVEDEEEACALTDALRLDAGRSVAKLRMADGTIARAFARVGLALATYVVLMGSFLLFFHTAGPGVAVVASVIFLGGYVFILARGHLTVSVGADGVHVGRWMGRARFLRYADIRRVTKDGPTVCIELRNDTTLTMSRGGGARVRWLLGSQEDEAQAIFARVASQVEVHRVRELASSVHGLLAKGARPTEKWLSALRICSDASASFRAAAIPPDVLWSVVEDTTAPPTSRVGAAVALRGALDHAATARLTLAAEGCAAPGVRVALERVARAKDDAGLTSALDVLDAEDANLGQPASMRRT
jgi:hypothetical protein